MIIIEDIIKDVKSYNPNTDAKLLWDAYQFTKKAFEGQKRFSGEDYIHHCLATAKNLADMKLDTAAIAAIIPEVGRIY